MDQRVLFVLLLINLGLTTVEKIRAALKASDPRLDEAELEVLLAEVDRRLARRA